MIYLYISVVITSAFIPEWMYAGKFDSPAACHKAAANLPVEKTPREHRCLSANTGEVK